MKVSVRTIYTLASGKWMGPDKDEMWECCDYILQKKTTNMELYSRGYAFCGSVLQEQFPELSQEDCSAVKDKESCDKFVSFLESKYGEFLTVQPSDLPFLDLSPTEEWALLKGISPEEAEDQVISI